MTARELITASLRLLGVKGSGDTLDSTEDSELIVILNDLLEGLANEGLFVPSRTIETLSWASGNASRTIGSGANLNTARPLRIEQAYIRDGNTDYPLDLVSVVDYEAIYDKTVTNSLPRYLAYNPTATAGTLYMWPVPSASVTLGLVSFKPFTAPAIGDTLAMNPGYNRMLRYNLAIELAPEYGKQAPQEVIAIAESTKDALRNLNLVVPQMGFDGAIPGVDDSTWNIYTGDM